jgi:hypothetical protein
MITLLLEKGANKDHGDIETAYDRAKSYNVDEFTKLFERY